MPTLEKSVSCGGVVFPKTYDFSHYRFHENQENLLFQKNLCKGCCPAFACNYVPSQVFGANSRINVAGIGVGGKGSSDVMGADKHGAKIVALCDVDLSRGARLIDFFTENDDKVKVYKDFRKNAGGDG